VTTSAQLVDNLAIPNIDNTLVQLTEDPTISQIDEGLAQSMEGLFITHTVTTIDDPVDQLAYELAKICLKRLTDADVSDGADFNMNTATVEDELWVSDSIERSAYGNILCVMDLDHNVHRIRGGNHQSRPDKEFGAISTSKSGACC
jgi:hypothetical protein